MATEVDPALLRSFLLERDAPCPGCGYNLRGVVTGVCPECKHVASLELAGSPRPRDSTVTLLMVLACIGALESIFEVGRTVMFYRAFFGPELTAWAVATDFVWTGGRVAVLIACCLALVKLLKSRGTDESKSAVDFSVRVLCFYVFLGLVSWLWLNAGPLMGWP